ncbi:MAG: YvcK family protein [Tenericutes bacterium]|nr:YvcK family protein [Mycoplasmatota bacterium]
MKKKIVVFGGGTGLSSLLTGLKDFPVEITAVITVSDNGRSTGKLREEFSTPAVGDIRKVLTNLSDLPEEIKSIMEYRFETYSDLDGHPLGNLVLTAMLNKTKNLKKSIEYLSKLLDVKHKVLPLSEDYLTLMGETYDGKIIEGEANLTKAHTKYKKIFYKETPHVEKDVLAAVKEADLIILSMGSLYTSILPHLLCKQIIEAINTSQAKVMYLCNAMTQPGETDNFGVSDHIDILEKYLGTNSIDVVVASNTKLDSKILEKYETEEQKDPVVIDYENLKNRKLEIIESDLLTTKDNTIRHNSLKLSSIIFSYLMR